MEIKINTLGKIIEGDNLGWYVKVIDDTNDTGGYFIYEFEDLDESIGFDTWLENINKVNGYFYESEWKIEWLE